MAVRPNASSCCKHSLLACQGDGGVHAVETPLCAGEASPRHGPRGSTPTVVTGRPHPLEIPRCWPTSALAAGSARDRRRSQRSARPCCEQRRSVGDRSVVEAEQSGVGRAEAACLAVEGVEVRFVVGMQPFASGCGHLDDHRSQKQSTNAAPLMGALDDGVEQKACAPPAQLACTKPMRMSSMTAPTQVGRRDSSRPRPPPSRR
jgi:hypothetical protein